MLNRLKSTTIAMKLIHLFLFSVFVGVAFGKELVCLGKEIPACSLKLNLKWTESNETNLCVRVNDASDCLESAAKICKDEAQKAMKDLVDLARDLCNTDSQMFQDLQKYQSCLKKPEFLKNFLVVCVAEYASELMDLGQPDTTNIQEYSDKVTKIICPNRENILNCGFGQIKSLCGEPSEKFYRKLVNPFDELLKETCDSASIPSISIALIFLQLLIAIFSSRKIF